MSEKVFPFLHVFTGKHHLKEHRITYTSLKICKVDSKYACLFVFVCFDNSHLSCFWVKKEYLSKVLFRCSVSFIYQNSLLVICKILFDSWKQNITQLRQSPHSIPVVLIFWYLLSHFFFYYSFPYLSLFVLCYFPHFS